MDEVMSPMDPSTHFDSAAEFLFLEPSTIGMRAGTRLIESAWSANGGKEQFQAQKLRHRLKERGREVGIENCPIAWRAAHRQPSTGAVGY